MPSDRYGLPVTTASPTALEAYDRGVEAALGWKANALDLFREATQLDPSLAVAHAGAAACLFLEERFGEARAASEAAQAAATPGVSPRERSYVNAVTLWTAGKVPEAEAAMREHLAQLSARPRRSSSGSTSSSSGGGSFPPCWRRPASSFATIPRAPTCWACTPSRWRRRGAAPEAIRLAEEAIARKPEDAWSIHALAHALYESAAFDTGVTRLPAAIEPCRGLNWFQNHLWWHLVLMHLSRGEYARVSDMSRRLFEQAPSSIAGDLHDSISLLWRLELTGHPPGDRWQPFTAIARDRIGRTGLLFHVAHVAMALAGGGDWAGAEKQLALLRERAPKDPTGLMGEVTLPLVEGLHAFAARDWPRVIAKIEPLRPRIVELGGSRAQRDVFHDTLIEACFRGGDMDRAERLLAERLHRRPDHFWLHRRQAGAAPSPS